MFYDAQCIRLRLLDGLVSVHASHLERCDINLLGNTRFTDNYKLATSNLSRFQRFLVLVQDLLIQIHLHHSSICRLNT